MGLETWRIAPHPQGGPGGSSPTHSHDPVSSVELYGQLNLLLKSILVASRTTPAYRLSRKQGRDSFVILYRIYLGQTILSQLGDGPHFFHLGSVVVSPRLTLDARVISRPPDSLHLGPQEVGPVGLA